MKKIHLLSALLIFATAAVAQQPTFKWAQMKNANFEGLSNPKIVLPSTNGFYTYSFEAATNPMLPSYLFVSKFDGNAEYLGNQKFEFPKRNRRMADLKTVLESADNKKLFFISELAIGKDNLNILYLQEYSDDQTKPESELEKMPFEKLSNNGSFDVAQSADRSKIVVLVHFPQEKEGKEKIKILVYDGAFAKIWEKEYTLEHPSERGYNEKLFVSNSGKVVLTKVEDESKKEPKITYINISEAEVTEKMIAEPGFYPSEYQITQSENGDIYLAGFYTDNWKPTISVGGRKEKGAFAYNITKGSLFSKNLFTENLHKEYSGNFIGLKILSLYMKKNQIYIVGDVQSVKSEMDKTPGSFATNSTYTSGPGVLAQIDEKGALTSALVDYDEMKHLNKMGVLNSFYPIEYNGKLFMLGNDSESKLKGKKLVVGRDAYSKTVIFNSFNSDGSITVNPIWETGTGGKDEVTLLAPSLTRKIDEQTYYVYSLGQNYQAFGKMTIK